MSASSPEDAVRRYLEWLEDPDSLIDDEAVARAEAAVADARDPLTRLHALADAEHARQADADAVIRDFITHARAYAEAQSIPIAAFRAVGVSDDVLRQAGFGLAGRVPAGRGPRGARAAGVRRGRSRCRSTSSRPPPSASRSASRWPTSRPPRAVDRRRRCAAPSTR